MRPTPEIHRALALLFPGVIASVNIDNFLLEQALDCIPDLDFVGARADAENVLVLFFAHQRRFFGQRRSPNDVVGLVHFVLSAKRSSALCVTRIFSKPSNCSVLTSDAVARRTGFTLRADLRVVSSNESEITKTFFASICFFNINKNDFVLSSGTTKLSMVRISPALIRSLSAFWKARRRTDLEIFFE